ncbi:MAG: hypothetical protein KY429_05245 [Actinobacteria bacterium]|nr:hypothetical protein [Actinomycetota bacterium]
MAEGEEAAVGEAGRALIAPPPHNKGPSQQSRMLRLSHQAGQDDANAGGAGGRLERPALLR